MNKMSATNLMFMWHDRSVCLHNQQ